MDPLFLMHETSLLVRYHTSPQFAKLYNYVCMKRRLVILKLEQS